MIHTHDSNETSPGSGASQAPAEPSYAPFLLALGITMVFWGIVTSPVMSMGGFVLLVGGLFLWIRAIATNWSKQDAPTH